MSDDDPDMTVEQYYEQFSDADELLAHYRECGDCIKCIMDKIMAHNHDAYVKMGKI